MHRIRTNSTTKLLLEAAERGNSAIVYSLLKTVASVNDTDGHQNTPLLLASARGHTKVVQIIINHGNNTKKEVNLTMNNLAGNTALHVACENGHLAIVKLLLGCSEFIRDINAQNANGDTALHLAAHQGNIDIVQQILLVETIDCNIRNCQAQSAARKARLRGNLSIYEMIKKRQDRKCTIM